MREDELSGLRREIDEARFTSSKFYNDNSNLASEVSALNTHVGVLNNQNFEVSSISNLLAE
jgi:hypothetical protein